MSGRFDFAFNQFGRAVVYHLVRDQGYGTHLARQAADKSDDSPSVNVATVWQRLAETSQTGGKPDLTDSRALYRAFAHEVDPTAGSRLKYLNWASQVYLNEAVNGRRIQAEDLYKLKGDLADHGLFNAGLPAAARDIGNIAGWPALQDTLRPFQQERDARRIRRDERLMTPADIARVTSQTLTLYEGPAGRIAIPLTAEAAIHEGRGTRWCVSKPGEDNLFDDYHQTAPLVMYFPEVTATDRARADHRSLRFFKFCSHGDHLWNEHDNDLAARPLLIEKLIDEARCNLPPAQRQYLKAVGCPLQLILTRGNQPFGSTTKRRSVASQVDESATFFDYEVTINQYAETISDPDKRKKSQEWLFRVWDKGIGAVPPSSAQRQDIPLMKTAATLDADAFPFVPPDGLNMQIAVSGYANSPESSRKTMFAALKSRPDLIIGLEKHYPQSILAKLPPAHWHDYSLLSAVAEKYGYEETAERVLGTSAVNHTGRNIDGMVADSPISSLPFHQGFAKNLSRLVNDGKVGNDDIAGVLRDSEPGQRAELHRTLKPVMTAAAYQQLHAPYLHLSTTDGATLNQCIEENFAPQKSSAPLAQPPRPA